MGLSLQENFVFIPKVISDFIIDGRSIEYVLDSKGRF
jgi:hypothetical protein